VVLAYVAAQIAALRSAERELHGGQTLDVDAVHEMRVATRRLRSSLATFRPMLDRTTTDPLRTDLRAAGRTLGGVRDVQVLRRRLVHTLDALPAGAVRGDPKERLLDALSRREEAARADLLVMLADDAYPALLNRLDALVAAPAQGRHAEKSARAVLPSRVNREWARVVARRSEAQRMAPADAAAALHDTRKAARRLRYAAEAVAPVVGSDARRFVRRATRVQEVLGDHQDTVVARALLLELADAALAAGADAFTYGALHEVETARADDALAAYDAAWSALDRRRIRAWLR